MARITFTGRLTKDPARKTTATGKKKLTFTVAENHRRHNNQTNQWETAGTTFHNVELRENAAARAAEAIAKGDLVTVIGEQQSRSYKDAAGKDATFLYVTASDIAKPIGSPNSTAGQGSPAPESEPAEDAQAAEMSVLPGWDAEADAAWKASGVNHQ